MKQKTRRKLLSVLLTLALVLGLMPGMSLAALADTDAWTSIKMDGDQLKKGDQTWSVENANIDGIGKKLSLPPGNYRLDSDIKTGGAIVVESGPVNFDLNGHGIIASGGFNVFYITGNGNLSITDSNSSTVHGYTISNPPSNTNGAGLATVHSTKQDGDTEFKGGFITGGKTTSGGIWGGAIQLKAGTCTVTGCTLIGNNASCGGAVNVQGNGSLSMSGTAIIGNTSDDHGGGVYNQGSSGTVTLTNCTIKYNYAGANGGGGVRVYKSITTIIDGCTITDNACSAGTHGGGICVGGLEDSDSATIKLKGNISINNNFCSDTKENLYLSDKNGGSFVYVDGKLSDTASIGVTMSSPGVFTKTDDENKEAWNDVSKFTSDNASYFVSKNNNGQLELSNDKTYTVTFKVVNGKWDDDTTADKTVTLTGNVSDTLKLIENQIPAVGNKPNDTYKAGSWDVTPSTETAITAATTYTYTYAVKEASVVTKAPEAKTLTYNGSAQALVTAGEATGGEMKYALGTNATTAPTENWSTDIPTGKDAGT